MERTYHPGPAGRPVGHRHVLGAAAPVHAFRARAPQPPALLLEDRTGTTQVRPPPTGQPRTGSGDMAEAPADRPAPGPPALALRAHSCCPGFTARAPNDPQNPFYMSFIVSFTGFSLVPKNGKT